MQTDPLDGLALDAAQRRIILAVCDVARVPADVLLGAARHRQAADARLVAYALMRERGYTLLDIAAIFGRDARTIHACVCKAHGRAGRVPVVAHWLDVARKEAACAD